MFKTSILVRFGDLDAAGIAYYPNLVNFLQVAFEDFFVDHVDVSPGSRPAAGGSGPAE